MNTKYVVISSDQGPIRVVGTFSVHEKGMTLFLNLFPGMRFYVADDDTDHSRLRIFSGRSTRQNTRPYFNQVGSGKRIEQLDAIELFFPDLNQKYYVYLKRIHVATSTNFGGINE
jgi:hypothetical protein